MKPLRIALTKGRLEKTTVELLEKIGYNCDEIRNTPSMSCSTSA